MHPAGFVAGPWKFDKRNILKVHEALADDLKVDAELLQVFSYVEYSNKAKREIQLEELFVALIQLQRALNKVTSLHIYDGTVMAKLAMKADAKEITTAALPCTEQRKEARRGKAGLVVVKTEDPITRGKAHLWPGAGRGKCLVDFNPRHGNDGAGRVMNFHFEDMDDANWFADAEKP